MLLTFGGKNILTVFFYRLTCLVMITDIEHSMNILNIAMKYSGNPPGQSTSNIIQNQKDDVCQKAFQQVLCQVNTLRMYM